jgi:hypothetical protein
MKNIFRISSLLLIAGIAILSSCKKSSSSPASIVGTWLATSQKTVTVDSSTNPFTVTNIDTTFANDSTSVIQLNADNSFEFIILSTNPPSLDQQGTYTAINGTLNLFNTDGSYGGTAKYTLGGNTFSLLVTEDSPGFADTISEKFSRQNN